MRFRNALAAAMGLVFVLACSGTDDSIGGNAPSEDTEAVQNGCGAQGQAACASPAAPSNPANKTGCKAGLAPQAGARGTVCKPCGQASEPACPYPVGAASGNPGASAGCGNGLFAKNGTCLTCGVSTRPPCPYLVNDNPSKSAQDKGCGPGLYTSQGLCTECGGAGKPACPYSVGGAGANPANLHCQSGLFETAGKCQPCGAMNQPKCPYVVSSVGQPCKDGLFDDRGTCRACGTAGSVACPYSVPSGSRSAPGCAAGLVVIRGVCYRPGPCVQGYEGFPACCPSGGVVATFCLQHPDPCQASSQIQVVAKGCSLEDAKAAAQLNATNWNVTEGLCSFRSKPPGCYP